MTSNNLKRRIFLQRCQLEHLRYLLWRSSSPTFKCPTFNEEFLPLIFLIMSHVFLTDDLEFNLDTYCRQDARLLCLIVRRAFARAILNFDRFSWVGLRLNCLRTDFRSTIAFLQSSLNHGLFRCFGFVEVRGIVSQQPNKVKK